MHAHAHMFINSYTYICIHDGTRLKRGKLTDMARLHKRSIGIFVPKISDVLI